jgi:hypothetical protein
MDQHSWELYSPDEYFLRFKRISPVLQYSEDPLDCLKIDIQSEILQSFFESNDTHELEFKLNEYKKMIKIESSFDDELTNFEAEVARERSLLKAKIAAKKMKLASKLTFSGAQVAPF